LKNNSVNLAGGWLNLKKGKDMKTYHVKYLMYASQIEKGIDVIAKSSAEAYDKAVYEKIPELEGSIPYGAFVYSYTTQGGKHHIFTKNMIGKGY